MRCLPILEQVCSSTQPGSSPLAALTGKANADAIIRSVVRILARCMENWRFVCLVDQFPVYRTGFHPGGKIARFTKLNRASVRPPHIQPRLGKPQFGLQAVAR